MSVRVRMRTEQAVSRAGPNRGRRDAKSLGHLFLRQESLVAQSVIATLESIVILDEINDYLPCKRSPVAGAMPVLVEYRRNAAGCVRFQQRVDLGPDGGDRLRQLPRAQGDGQGERSRAPAAEAHMGRDRVLSSHRDIVDQEPDQAFSLAWWGLRIAPQPREIDGQCQQPCPPVADQQLVQNPVRCE